MHDPAPLTPAERAAIQARLQERGHAVGCETCDDIRALLATVAALETERDAARADLKRIADRLCREDEEYAAKVARLDAVVQAAREVAETGNISVGHQFALERLRAAVAVYQESHHAD